MRNAFLTGLLLITISVNLNAQLRADFVPDKAGGCSPVSISFTNTTTGASSNATYHWNFGNGNSSDLKNAAAIYDAEKTYNVTLTVKDGTQTSTQQKTITVYKKPAVDFSFSPNNGCLPMQVSFNSSSSTSDGNISAYHWDFGDGATQQSFGPSINHIYNFEQTATVSLTAVTNHGCANTITKENIIKVHPSIHAAFAADRTVHCNAPATVKFSNSSKGPGTLSYVWDFGDGNTSTELSPSHTYNQKGTYHVKLTVKSSEGCTDVMLRSAYINVDNFSTNIEIPSLVCVNSNIRFNRVSSPTPTRSTWFVDGVQIYTYDLSFINYTFVTPGTHTVQLVNEFEHCTQTVTKEIDVKPIPQPGFISTIQGLCGAPVNVLFKDTTSDVVSRSWNFNYHYDYNTVHSTAKEATHNYQTDNWYYISMKAVNADGCSASVIQLVAISKPLVGIHLDNDTWYEGCQTLTLKFNARSTEEIIKYAWRFGDGDTSSEAAPVHTYKNIGSYPVSLTYTTVNGCTGTVTYFRNIEVRQKPKADFKVQPLVCGNTPVAFTNNSTGYVTQYVWDFGDGTRLWEFTPLPHAYQQEGMYDVTLIAYNGLCNDTITKKEIVKVVPPFAKILQVSNTCDGSRGMVSFTDGSRQVDKWHWDFGDGNTTSYNSSTPQITHTYSKSGTYKVALSVSQGSCTVKDSVTVYVLLKQKPELKIDQAESCIDKPLTFHIKGLEQNPEPYSTYYNSYYIKKWENSDGNPLNGYYYYFDYWKTNVSGQIFNDQIKVDQIRAVITSPYFNCDDTTNYVPVKINGVEAGFEIHTDNDCFKSPVTFKDISKASAGNTIETWEWDFGDGNKKTATQGGTVSHVYANPGNYVVRLTVTDSKGCSSNNTDYKFVRVTGPKAAFSISTSNSIQLNTTVNFYNYTNTANANNVTYLWNFGDNITSTSYSPTHVFTKPGEYVVSLIAENAQTQCRDTTRQTITVKNFNTGFTTSTSFIGNHGKCLPVRANFVNTSINYTKLEWNFGDGFTLENQIRPGHVYNKPGTYVVTLKVYGYNGLTGTYRDTVFVNSPAASINADDLEGCIGNKVILNAPVHSNASNFIWDFGNGQLINSSDSFSTHSYLVAGNYSPALLVTDRNGCSSSVGLPDKIIIHPDPVIDVTSSSLNVCKTNEVQLKASGAASYIWSPVDGLNNTTLASPIATPAASTTYTVNATDVHGCKGAGSITIQVLQPFNMEVTGQVEICKGEHAPLNASGADAYQWINTTTGLSATGIPNPMAFPLTSTTYTVVGFDRYNCYSDTADINVIVRPLPVVDAGNDLEVFFGSENSLNITNSNDVVRWSWSPNEFLSCSNCPNPVMKPYKPMEYIVSVYNNFNCEAKDTLKINAVCGDANIYIPSAFTPGHDGKNDKFTVFGNGIGMIKSFRIYNRWGELVFDKKNIHPNDYSTAWDGKYKGADSPTEVYVYFIEMECTAGEKIVRKGTVTIVR